MTTTQRYLITLLALGFLQGCASVPPSRPVVEAAYAPTACDNAVPATARRRDGDLWEDVFKLPNSSKFVFLGSNLMLEDEKGLFKQHSYSCFYDTGTRDAEFSNTKIVVLVLDKAHKAMGIQTNMTAGKYQIIGTTDKGWLHASYQNEHIEGGGKPGFFGAPSGKNTVANIAFGGIGGALGSALIAGERPRIAYRPDKNEVCAKPGGVWLCKSYKSVPFRFETIELDLATLE